MTTRTPCLSCLCDVSELDARGLCPDCAALRAECDDHPSTCACVACLQWAAIDGLRAVLQARADEWTLGREVGL